MKWLAAWFFLAGALGLVSTALAASPQTAPGVVVLRGSQPAGPQKAKAAKTNESPSTPTVLRGTPAIPEAPAVPACPPGTRYLPGQGCTEVEEPGHPAPGYYYEPGYLPALPVVPIAPRRHYGHPHHGPKAARRTPGAQPPRRYLERHGARPFRAAPHQSPGAPFHHHGIATH